jgi:PleD family two-component response regulator
MRVKLSGHSVPIRHSVGWATYTPGDSAEQLLKRADQALYAHKRRPATSPEAAEAPVPGKVTA